MGIQKSRMILDRTLRVYLWVIIAIFAVLFIRVGWLQIVQTELYRMQAESNIVRWIPEPAARGEIMDKNGLVLATSRPVFNVSLSYLGQQEDTDEVIRRLVGIINDPDITLESVKAQIAAQRNRLFEPIIIKRDIPIELVTAIEERRRELSGVNIDTQPQRSYNYGTLAGHLLGYVHSIKEELEQPGYEDYGLNDLVGKTGLEKIYEKYLRGKNGFEQLEVTAKNRPVRPISSLPAIAGNSLTLTIDLKLQQTMEKSFDETLLKVQRQYPKAQAGAAVLLDVKTGKVLALTSRPVLNPDDFNGRKMNQDQADYYFRNVPTALNNRAIQGSYVPGSTFKPITGMAALESGLLSPTEYVNCSGKYWYSPYIKCWSTHGNVNFYSAMAGSCNVYFQECARRAGIAQIGRVGFEFGLGRATGIDLPFESSGLLPSLEWQNTEYKTRADRINKNIDQKIASIEAEYNQKIDGASSEREKTSLERELSNQKRIWENERKIQLNHYTTWHDWDTFNTGIGQGYNQYTVIQLANMTATIANGGSRFRPYLVERITAADGTLLEQFQPQLESRTTVSEQTIKETKKAMLGVTAPRGTAYSLFSNFPPEIQVGAKTGTAQPGRTGYVKNKDFDGLFIAFAPADDPQIAFAGVIEHGASGSGSIGLVCKSVFEEYFGLLKVELDPTQIVGDEHE